MSSFLSGILFSVAKKALEWISELIISWFKTRQKISKSDSEIDAKVKKYTSILAEVKESGGATDENKARLINAARSIIRG